MSLAVIVGVGHNCFIGDKCSTLLDEKKVGLLFFGVLVELYTHPYALSSLPKVDIVLIMKVLSGNDI